MDIAKRMCVVFAGIRSEATEDAPLVYIWLECRYWWQFAAWNRLASWWHLVPHFYCWLMTSMITWCLQLMLCSSGIIALGAVRKFFYCCKFLSINAKFEAEKLPFWGNFGAKLECLACINFFVGNFQHLSEYYNFLLRLLFYPVDDIAALQGSVDTHHSQVMWSDALQ